MGREFVKSPEISGDGIDMICERLSRMPDLYLPHALATRADPVSQIERKDHLANLLRRDAAVFLERYGKSLNSVELQEFEALQEDYEVNWHLKALKSAMNPSAEEQRSRAATVQNRRLAFMNRLVQDGQYFSEDSMRMRSPLMHYEHVGQFQDPAVRDPGVRPGERFSDTLIRRSEEAYIQERLREERVAAGIPVEEPAEDRNRIDEESEFEEEYDTESEDEEQMAQAEQPTRENPTDSRASHPGEAQGHASEDGRPGETSGEEPPHTSEGMSGEETTSGSQYLSHAELADKMEDFTRLMQEKFLSGMDSEHVDYGHIDNNAALDDDWMPEITRDAEEKYFEED
ncbi:hypothetical protein KC19_5G192100 [Ceratodon purpureus]|uniref:CCD97-like C-terminal domain-containing protein n=1 Tax=Ceratodon purpureus TaxID=3225 RepID=A0A8T0I4P0_CERPU|nr:hypothetical protein KC19_5G192100 [Ceratodon purpureus]